MCRDLRPYGEGRPFKSQHPKRSRVKQHDRALKKVTQLKNEARRALHRAWKCDESVSTLAAKFLSLIRDNSRLKRASARRLHQKDAKIAREECHTNFWRYAKGLLDGKATSQTTPEFSATTAHTFLATRGRGRARGRGGRGGRGWRGDEVDKFLMGELLAGRIQGCTIILSILLRRGTTPHGAEEGGGGEEEEEATNSQKEEENCKHKLPSEH